MMHQNENQGFQAESHFVPVIFSPTTPASSSPSTSVSIVSTPPCTPIRTSMPSNVESPSLESMQLDVELPGASKIQQTPSPGFAIKERKAASMNWIKDYKLPESFSPRVHKDLMDGKLSGNLRDEFTRDVVSSIKVHTMYPTSEEKQKVASLIIRKYPFLADSIGAGTGSWCKAITNRFKNLRRKKACGETPACKKIKPIDTLKSAPSTKKRKLADFPNYLRGKHRRLVQNTRKSL